MTPTNHYLEDRRLQRHSHYRNMQADKSHLANTARGVHKTGQAAEREHDRRERATKANRQGRQVGFP